MTVKECQECEVYAQHAEKFGDLSCCYDAQDVTRVIDRKFEELQESSNMLVRAMKKAMSLTGTSTAHYQVMKKAISDYEKNKK